MKQFYTIPIFIPEKACPFRCIYCNQYKITNHKQIIDLQEIHATIRQYLDTFPKDATKRIAFFGGTFTGMSMEEQNYYLDAVQPYLQNGDIACIQLSTRPDYINVPILENLKKHGVQIIELGAQSLDDEVLQFSGRGHTVKDVEIASKLILQYDFTLGLQMMVGLPYDTLSKTEQTARTIVNFGAACTRIYPTLVIRDTYLAKLYEKRMYQPLTMDEAVNFSLAAMEIFEKNHLTVLRVGLHPSEGLLDGTQLIAGPFHVSFKELVMTEKWNRRLLPYCRLNREKEFSVAVHPSQLNAAIGYQGRNKKQLLQYYFKVQFLCDNTLGINEFKIIE